MSRDNELLADLLLRWEELRGQRREVAPEELCRDHPHLLPELERQIAALTAMGWVDEAADPDGDVRPDPVRVRAHRPREDGRRLGGRYRLDRLIAEGGSGQVWEGYDEELQRPVAVKVPRTARSSTSPPIDFLAEGRRVARLEHPGIVPVYDVSQDDGGYYIVSKLVTGDSAADRLGHGRFDPADAAWLVAGVARSLDHAHRQGFVHRDIKPANILLDTEGRPFLTDFGIAVTSPELMTASRSGTLSYMSPEQLAGDTRRLDRRTDIYSLGVVLYEMLTGRQPFRDDNPVAVRDNIVAGVYRRFRDMDRMIPAALDRIAAKCMAKDAERRYQTAEQLADDLERYGQHSAPGHWGRPAHRGLVVLAVFGLIALGTIFISSMGRPDGPLDLPNHLTPQTTPAPDPPRTFGAAPEDVKVLIGHTGRVSCLAFQQGSALVASGGADKTVRLWDTDKPDPTGGHLILRHPVAVTAVAYQPGRAVVAAGCENGQVSLWDVSAPEPKETKVFAGHAGAVTRITFSPDGDMLFSGDVTGAVRVHDLTRSPPGVAVLPKETGKVFEITAHGNGPRLVVAVADDEGMPAELHFWELEKAARSG